MGKFQLRKPRIISKNFPEVGSHIDNVSKSLNDLVFSYSEQVDRALQKKHMMMALSSLVLVLVVGSFISPRGKADIATFYPETCLGGWSNPRNAEKEGETTSNADPSQFNDKNSSILDKNTAADIYCGNFNGTFNDATVPKKIIVSLAITNKEEITIGELATTTSDLATSTEVSSDTASTTLLLATSSDSGFISSSTDITSLGSTSVASSSDQPTGSTTEPASTAIPASGDSFVEIIVGAVTETLGNIFNGAPSESVTDTVVVPPPVEQPASAETVPAVDVPVPNEAPVSFMQSVFKGISSLFVTTVFAQESSEEVAPLVSTETVLAPTETEGQVQSSSDSVDPLPETQSVAEDGATASSSPDESVLTVSITSDLSLLSTTTASTTEELLFTSSSTLASTTEVVSTSSEVLSEEVEESQNNFLEILYTFDGVTWTSLGELNEISMKYRTFEISLSASSTWSDMSQLQIKVATKSLERETLVTYLDAIKVEVLYESTLEYSHPDFTRDTILNDETIDGIRLVTIINNETNEEETWYMYIDEDMSSSTTTVPTLDMSTTTASTTVDTLEAVAMSTQELSVILSATSTTDLATTTSATTTDVVATSTSTSTPVIAPVLLKNKWFKLEKKQSWSTLSPREIVLEIKKGEADNEKEVKEEDRLPNFAKDLIKRIKGSLLNAIIVQVEKDGKEELWLYDLENGGEQKIEAGTSTSVTIAKDMQIGVKDTHLFWLSEDRATVYAFNLVDKSIQLASVPLHDTSIGERGRVTFSGVKWEVIVGAQDFAFYSEQTGEVFSDDDSSLSEALRQKFELDSKLDVDTISNLNLPVTATSTTE